MYKNSEQRFQQLFDFALKEINYQIQKNMYRNFSLFFKEGLQLCNNSNIQCEPPELW